MAKAKLSSAVLFLSSQLTFQAESSQKSWIKCKSKVSKVSESRGAAGAGGTETSEGEALREKDEGEVLGDKLRTSACFPGPRHSGPGQRLGPRQAEGSLGSGPGSWLVSSHPLCWSEPWGVFSGEDTRCAFLRLVCA